jgi:hypothetical protein
MAVRKRTHERVIVSASELSQLGVCERLVVFEDRFGKRWSADRAVAVQRGLRVHRQFHRDGSQCQPHPRLRPEVMRSLLVVLSWATQFVSRLVRLSRKMTWGRRDGN